MKFTKIVLVIWSILALNMYRKEEIVGGLISRQTTDEAFKKLYATTCNNIMSITPKKTEDAISRQEAIESIKNLYPDMPVMNIMGARRKWLEKYKPYIECENAVEHLPPVTPKQSGWIPVSEKLPEKDTYVLVTTKWEDGSTELGIDAIVDGKWILGIADEGDTVTAWMPLPEPYKPESEDSSFDK